MRTDYLEKDLIDAIAETLGDENAEWNDVYKKCVPMVKKYAHDASIPDSDALAKHVAETV